MTPAFEIMAKVPWDPRLRWYQREAILRILAVLSEQRSALLVMATGTGKSVVFSDMATRWPGRVLLLAHRDELVLQAREHFLHATGGEWVDVEKAELRAELRTRLVVGSVQTLASEARLRRFPPDHFDFIIVDEAHHATAPTYRKVLDYFKSAKVLGVTATPDRADEKAMGQVFDDVAFIYDIGNGIDDGYLVPLLGQRVFLEEIDISHVGVTQGDLVLGQLDTAIIKAMEGIVQKTLEIAPDRRGVIFTPGVKSAELAAQRFNFFKPNSAIMIHGGTDKEERRELIRAYKRGDYQYLCNCDIATEGFDDPTVNLICQGRPTKSRSKYAQQIGRGTRPLPKLLESYHAKDDGQKRRAAIDWSDKPDCLVLDFVGNTGKHKLATVEDVLGGDYTEAEVELAKKKAKAGGNVSEALREARREIAEYANKVSAKVTGRQHQVDLFAGETAEEEDRYARRFGYKPMSPGQRQALLKWGYTEADLENVDRRGASRMMDERIAAKEQGLASIKQLRTLRQFAPVPASTPFARASAAMNYLIQKSYRNIDGNALQRILNHERVPGEEG